MGKFSPKEQYNPASTPFTYRYPLRIPTMAKISSVASHKRNLIAAAAAAAASSAAKSQSNDSERTSIEVGVTEKIDATINKSSSSSSKVSSSGNSSLKTSSSVDQLLSKPNIQEDLRRELDDLNKYSELIKKDIKTLSNIRGNVIWLLKKVTHANTLKNHKGENVVKNK